MPSRLSKSIKKSTPSRPEIDWLHVACFSFPRVSFNSLPLFFGSTSSLHKPSNSSGLVSLCDLLAAQQEGFLIYLFTFFFFFSSGTKVQFDRMMKGRISVLLVLALCASCAAGSGSLSPSLCLASLASSFFEIFLFFFSLLFFRSDQLNLVVFWRGLTSSGGLNWNTTASLCGQTGVTCNGASVVALCDFTFYLFIFFPSFVSPLLFHFSFFAFCFFSNSL